MLKILVYVFLMGLSLILSAQSTFQLTIEKNDSTSPSSPTHSITETANGEIYAMSTISPGGWYNKIRLVKLNANGVMIWDTTYAHTPEHEFFPEIMPAHDGGVIVASTSFSYILYENDTVSDILVWKINTEGVIEWQKVLAAREFYDMVVTKDGGYLFLGSIHEKPFNQGLDIVVYKTDVNGNLLWSKQLGQQTPEWPYERERPNAIRQIDNQIYVCGYHNHDGWLELDGVMYALDANGNLLWDIFIPHTDDDDDIRINSVFKFNNQYYFNGYGMNTFDPGTGFFLPVPDSLIIGFTGKGYNFAIPCGEKKMIVINPNSGNYLLKFYEDLVEPYYQKVITGISGSFVEMVTTHDGGILVLTAGGESMQITKTDCLGNVDFWSDECNSKIPTDVEIIIYPNPSPDEIRIDAAFDFNEVVIFSPNGQFVSYENPCSCPRQTLDVSELASGVYIVRISSDENFAVSKFVKI